MSSPSAIFAAKPHMPSQLDECGAPISTSLGMSGNAPTMRQPPSRSTRAAEPAGEAHSA